MSGDKVIVALFGLAMLIAFGYFVRMWTQANSMARRLREMEYEKELQDEMEKSRSLPIDDIVERIRDRLKRSGSGSDNEGG